MVFAILRVHHSCLLITICHQTAVAYNQAQLTRALATLECSMTRHEAGEDHRPVLREALEKLQPHLEGASPDVKVRHAALVVRLNQAKKER